MFWYEIFLKQVLLKFIFQLLHYNSFLLQFIYVVVYAVSMATIHNIVFQLPAALSYHLLG
jgi:hypothetical protein